MELVGLSFKRKALCTTHLGHMPMVLMQSRPLFAVSVCLQYKKCKKRQQQRQKQGQTRRVLLVCWTKMLWWMMMTGKRRREKSTSVVHRHVISKVKAKVDGRLVLGC